jgi:hypothetical protein
MKTLNLFLISGLIIFISHGFANAQDSGEDSHAKAIRLALEAGGMNTEGHPSLSKYYGPFLSKLGFSLISAANYNPKAGDIRVFQPYLGGDTAGHVVSDFKEGNFWPSAKYKKYHPDYQVFRWIRNKS